MFRVIAQSSPFGEFSRFKLVAGLTRFNQVEFSVLDAESPDETGMPGIVRQSDTIWGAVEGLGYPSKFPNTGDWVVNLDKTLGRFSHASNAGWVLESPESGRWIASSDKCLVLR